MTSALSTILALDVGERRIGVAVANSVARIARPLTTLERGGTTLAELHELINAEHADTLVLGLPRNLSGQATAQTTATRAFADQLHDLGLPIHWQDEAVTSRQAEEELRTRGKPYAKGDIDALSAAYILEDFLRDHPGGQTA